MAFGGNEQRAIVFLDRYSLKDNNGNPVERLPEDMWSRVAAAIADDEPTRVEFHNLLRDFKFVPGGRILAGAGTGTEVTYYNCFVIPVETRARRQARGTTEYPNKIEGDRGADSREAIFDTMGLMVDIMSRGGGVGINWSVLRPKGAHLKRVNGTTSGPVSWMDVASKAVGVVEQGGSRRGAAMFMLDDWHPDVEEFINAKRDFGVITNANVSVAVSDDFMAAVETDGEWVLRFPDTSDPLYDTRWDGDLGGWQARGGKVVDYKRIRARELWRSLAEAAWASGEPGVVFLSRYNDQSTADGVERIISVNPCGEQGLGPYSVCNLGAMNLDAYLYEPIHSNRGGGWDFNWAKFQGDVRTAVTFLDNIIDKTYYFIPQNEEVQKKLRRIGLGVMGLADALLALGLVYGSQEAADFTHRVFEIMKVEAVKQSSALAATKGPAPAYRKDMLQRPYFDSLRDTPMFSSVRKNGLRNLFLLTQAPTGTTSLLAGVNSGIEPYFAFAYTRKDRTGTHKVLASAVGKYKDPARSDGSEWVTSNDVSVDGHVLMQAAAQDSIDSSVSKTINAPYEHTVEGVEEAYTLAYKRGCKGVAYFRDGCGRDQVLYRDGVPVKVDNEIEELKKKVEELERSNSFLVKSQKSKTSFARPPRLEGETHRVQTKAGTAYVTVNRDNNSRPVEVFFNVGKAGSDITALAEALGRTASLALRHGASLGGVANQLDGIGGNSRVQKAIPAAIAEALTEANKPKVNEEEAVKADDLTAYRASIETAASEEPLPSPIRADICPDCGNASLVQEEGCSKCQICGYSAC